MTSAPVLADVPAAAYLDRFQADRVTARSYHPGLLRHFVAFKFKPGVSVEQIDSVRSRFLALQRECVRDGKPYVLSIESGAANSFEGADQGMTLGFIVSFASEGDRNYYVGQPLIDPEHQEAYDPAHLRFKEFVGPLLAAPGGAYVFDFTVERRAK